MDEQEIGSAVRHLVIAWLEWHKRLDARESAGELEQLVEGYRIVDGGQIDSDDNWEVKDAHTGEVLAQGVGIDTYQQAWQPSWTHIDAISQGAFDEDMGPDETFGLPASLADLLRDWVSENREEAIQLVRR